MRVIFELPAVPVESMVPGPTVAGRSGAGRAARGKARFRVTVFDPGEAAVEGPALGRPLPLVSEWLRTLAPGEPIRIPPPEDYVGPVGEVVIPRALLDSLPDDASLWVEWKFFVGDKS